MHATPGYSFLDDNIENSYSLFLSVQFYVCPLFPTIIRRFEGCIDMVIVCVFYLLIYRMMFAPVHQGRVICLFMLRLCTTQHLEISGSLLSIGLSR